MKDLIWHRGRDGSYRTETIGNVEFAASVRRVGGEWHLATTTFGLSLSIDSHRTLARAKAHADSTYRTVEGVTL